MGRSGFGRREAALGRRLRRNWSTPEMKVLATQHAAGGAINHDPATGHEDGNVGATGRIQGMVASQDSKIGERSGPFRIPCLAILLLRLPLRSDPSAVRETASKAELKKSLVRLCGLYR
jgi:hypothetical protein